MTRRSFRIGPLWFLSSRSNVSRLTDFGWNSKAMVTFRGLRPIMASVGTKQWKAGFLRTDRPRRLRRVYKLGE